MSDSQDSSSADSVTIPAGTFAIGPYKRRRRAEEHGLVILSMHLSYELVHHDGGFYLWVDEAAKDAIYTQLEKYQHESKRWPPRPLASLPGDFPDAPLTLLGYVALMVAFFTAQLRWPEQLESIGAMNNELLFAGQWQRAATALTLHADVGHLIANVMAGLCFGYLMNRTLGAGIGWSLVLASGFLGNILNAWFYSPELHLSLGASTAIFGALGLLVGHALAGKFSPGESTSLRQRAVPLFAGIVILLLTGFSGGNTDIMAHVFGFAAGLPLGAMGLILARRWPRMATSRWLLALPLVTISIAWLTAATTN